MNRNLVKFLAVFLIVSFAITGLAYVSDIRATILRDTQQTQNK